MSLILLVILYLFDFIHIFIIKQDFQQQAGGLERQHGSGKAMKSPSPFMMACPRSW
jgi:hypothetical protein